MIDLFNQNFMKGTLIVKILLYFEDILQYSNNNAAFTKGTVRNTPFKFGGKMTMKYRK